MSQLKRRLAEAITSTGCIPDSIDAKKGFQVPVLTYWTNEGCAQALKRVEALLAAGNPITGHELNRALYEGQEEEPKDSTPALSERGTIREFWKGPNK